MAKAPDSSVPNAGKHKLQLKNAILTDGLDAADQASVAKHAKEFHQRPIIPGSDLIVNDRVPFRKQRVRAWPTHQRDYVLLHWTSGAATHPQTLSDETYASVHFYVGRLGTIYRYVDETKFATCSTKNGDVNGRAISIETANAGRLFSTAKGNAGGKAANAEPAEGDFLYLESGGVKYCRTADTQLWKRIGHYNYATFTDVQMQKTVALVRILCTLYKVPFVTLSEKDRPRGLTLGDSGSAQWTSNDQLKKFRGIVTHKNVGVNHDDELMQFDWSLFNK